MKEAEKKEEETKEEETKEEETKEVTKMERKSKHEQEIVSLQELRIGVLPYTFTNV